MKIRCLLLTALLLLAGVSGAYAGRHYVGFTSVPTGTNNPKSQLKTVLDNANSGDTVFVAVGLYLADTLTAVGELIVPQGVTLIGGYAKGDATTLTRRYPGQFIPFKSSVVDTNEFTILDGNAYQRTLASKKHRVITVQNGGVVDGVLIRNGHIRNGNGGGAFLDGGKLYNSIVRGNVAMSKPDTIESLGGGVFIQNSGELINCLVAYNMANDGYGVAAGVGGGKMINNTITANTYAPVFAKISGGIFNMYQFHSNGYRSPDPTWPNGEIPKYPQAITLREFYISRIQTTEGQYAVFCAAMDIAPVVSAPITGKLDVGALAALREPVLDGGDVKTRYNFNNVTGMQEILRTPAGENQPGLKYDGGVWYPYSDTASVEYPMGYVSWWGCLAYSVWLGGGLPSQAQWEYAARSEPNGTLNDNLYSGAYGSTDTKDTVIWRILDTIAWVANTKSIDTAPPHKLGIGGASRVHEVARKRPNAMGIYDMAGNLYDYCADWGKQNYTDFLYSSSYTNPINTAYYSDTRVVIGGAYALEYFGDFSLPRRSGGNPSQGSNLNGFRPIVAF